MKAEPKGGRRTASAGRWLRITAGVLAVSTLVATNDGPPALAFGDERSLTLFHTHRNETATITYRRNGVFDADGLEKLNTFLRDWRNDQQTRMDPRLFDVVWEAYRESGSKAPIQIISAYRSPVTNAMLHRRSRAVAEQSQHMLGKAMDIRLADVDTARLRATAMRLQHGGVGYYSSEKFVHVDTGSIRAWPRMGQDQLAKLFPDGKTVHLPSNGKPLPGYQEAKAALLARGETVEGVTTTMVAEAPIGARKSFFAALFGSSRDTTQGGAAPEQEAANALPASASSYVETDPQPAASPTPLPLRRPIDLPGAVVTAAAAAPSETGEAAMASMMAGLLSREAGWSTADTQDAAVQALFSVQPKPASRGPVRIAQASVKLASAPNAEALAPPEAVMLDIRFTLGPATDLGLARFSGPAVRNLRTASLLFDSL
ncbi:hypothetical protein GCM10007036_18340 [Alsobacter metallidurans]|uniref:Murein endopeptidase K n=1 Tax=Alsobacter metallidurans TaxID=340221 RepID=A0A917MHU5_9HYPH|nr:DUF882 domain-containing protein [Alsobacter metallidurans]GGH17118.1 hypothetical protein GCM10007036_18340 [Alsobacter metallidurans]